MNTDHAKAYEAPAVRVLGTVRSLTQWTFPEKQWGGSDGFLHIPISTTS